MKKSFFNSIQKTKEPYDWYAMYIPIPIVFILHKKQKLHSLNQLTL